MAEYFGFLIEFAREGSEQCLLLLEAGTVDKCARFYLANRRPQASKSGAGGVKGGRLEETVANGGGSVGVKTKRKKVSG